MKDICTNCKYNTAKYIVAKTKQKKSYHYLCLECYSELVDIRKDKELKQEIRKNAADIRANPNKYKHICPECKLMKNNVDFEIIPNDDGVCNTCYTVRQMVSSLSNL